MIGGVCRDGMMPRRTSIAGAVLMLGMILAASSAPASIMLRSGDARPLVSLSRLALRGGAALEGAAEAQDAGEWYKEEENVWEYEDVKGPWGDEMSEDGDAWLQDGEDEGDEAAVGRAAEGLPPLTEPGPDGKWDVTLHVYDLVMGMSKNASDLYPDATPIDALWQVSTVSKATLDPQIIILGGGGRRGQGQLGLI